MKTTINAISGSATIEMGDGYLTFAPMKAKEFLEISLGLIKNGKITSQEFIQAVEDVLKDPLSELSWKNAVVLKCGSSNV